MPAGATLKRRSRAVPWRPILTGHRARLARQVIVFLLAAVSPIEPAWDRCLFLSAGSR